MIRVGDKTFHYVTFDSDADVLYAAEAQPLAGTGQETPEGHVLRFDETGRFYGITFISPKWLLERDGALYVTLPSGETLPVEGIEAALGQPA